MADARLEATLVSVVPDPDHLAVLPYPETMIVVVAES